MANSRRALTNASAALLLAMTVGACSLLQPTSVGSVSDRHRFYFSIEELAADSSFVVVGTVVSPVKAGSPEEGRSGSLLSDVTIEKIVQNEVVGSTAPLGALEAPPVGSVIQVRQGGTVAMSGTGLLAQGSTYLLFLVPTQLEGAASTQFYPTGDTAGVWQQQKAVAKSPLSFSRPAPDSGDALPTAVSPDSLFG